MGEEPALKKRVCENCRFFQEAGFAKNGWCNNPQRKETSDVKLLSYWCHDHGLIHANKAVKSMDERMARDKAKGDGRRHIKVGADSETE